MARATLRVLLRDFETERLDELAQLLAQAAATAKREFPGVRVDD